MMFERLQANQTQNKGGLNQRMKLDRSLFTITTYKKGVDTDNFLESFEGTMQLHQIEEDEWDSTWYRP